MSKITLGTTQEIFALREQVSNPNLSRVAKAILLVQLDTSIILAKLFIEDTREVRDVNLPVYDPCDKLYALVTDPVVLQEVNGFLAAYGFDVQLRKGVLSYRMVYKENHPQAILNRDKYAPYLSRDFGATYADLVKVVHTNRQRPFKTPIEEALDMVAMYQFIAVTETSSALRWSKHSKLGKLLEMPSVFKEVSKAAKEGGWDLIKTRLGFELNPKK